jgi:hypothetical protein
MALSPKVKAYFRAQAAAVAGGGFWDCRTAAETLARLFLGDGRSPWIGRLRKSQARGDTVFHAPLIPRLVHGALAWTTHYVCVERGVVYDPAGLRPWPMRRYSQAVFGQDLPIETFVAQADIARHLEATSAALLARIITFIRSIGIEVVETEMHRVTLVPGIDIRSGRLAVEPKRMCRPADLLHEAAHIALKPRSERALLDGTAGSSPAEELSAIAWTWAAAAHLRIDPVEVFHDDVPSGNGQTLRENFTGGHYLGVPMLEYWGMTRARRRPGEGGAPYPAMIRWTREN